MEAEEPQQGASTPIPAGAEFPVIQAAPMRSSQTPALEPSVEEGEDLWCQWAKGRTLLETQQRRVRDVNDCAAESMSSLLNEASAEVETDQETLTAEACDDTPSCREARPRSLADGQARTPASLELRACPDQGDCPDTAWVSRDLGSSMEVDLRPELTSLILETGQAEGKEETSPDACARTRRGPSCDDEHPAEPCRPLEDSECGPARQESPSPVCLQGTEGLEEGELQGEAAGSAGLSGAPEQMGEQVKGAEEEGRQKQQQMQNDVVLAGQGEREGRRRGEELGGLSYREGDWRTQSHRDLEQGEQKGRESTGPEENEVDAQDGENQSSASKSEKGSGKPEDPGVQREAKAPEGQEEEVGSPEEEPGGGEGDTPGGGGEESGIEPGEREGPTALALVAPEVSPPCDLPREASSPPTRTPGTQTEPGAEVLSPVAPSPAPEPTGCSHQPFSLPGSCPAEESPDPETAHRHQKEGSELGQETPCSGGAEVVSASSPSATPPRSPEAAAPSPPEGPPGTAATAPAHPLAACPRREPSVLACSPETSRASHPTDSPSPRGAPETPSAAHYGFPLAGQASPPGSLGSPTGTVQPVRSNSFPGSHGTEAAPHLVGISLSSSHSELPQRPPKPVIYGSVLPRRGRRSVRDCTIIPEASSSPPTLGQDFGEPASNPAMAGSAPSSQPWGPEKHRTFAPGSPACGSSPTPVTPVDLRIHEPPPLPPPERRHVQPSTVERDGHLPAGVPTLKQYSHPSTLTLATPWTPEVQRPTFEPGLSEESEAPARGSWRRTAPQEGSNGLRRSEVGPARQPERPGHVLLEKASSWPHRRDPRRPAEAGSEAAAVPGEGSSKHKDWHRQGLRRPSILPESPVDTRGPTIEESPGLSDAIVFREKKPKEVMGSFSRQCSKLINSSQLLYQEYSDVFLNKEIQSQQRLDSLTEAPGPMSPRQPRKALVSSESYLRRLSMASSGSLWQEIPVVRNSTVLLSMTHEDQKLQEAKFELIVSEASYLRSLHIAVDHFQHSEQLRATLSNQDHQWLFSRLQDVRDVSTMFLSDLEENFENNIFTFQVCDVVLNHAPNFRRVYLPYVTNQTYQERTFQSLLARPCAVRPRPADSEPPPSFLRARPCAVRPRPADRSVLALCAPARRTVSPHPPFSGPVLALCAPARRTVSPHPPFSGPVLVLCAPALWTNILKRTQPGSAEEAEATKAHHALEELIRDCNNNVQRMRRTEELIYLSQKIEFECKIFPLISQSRWLVKSGELTALEFSVSQALRRKLNTRPVHLHLFNDCLLLSRPREGSRFLVFDHAPFSAVRGEKCEMKLHGAHKNLFRLFLRQNAQGSQAEFLLRTETQSEKLRWISALAMPREELDLLECYDSPQVQCLRAYKPRENDELALEKADVVMVTQQSSDGWLEGVRLSDGERGWFPLQQVEFISNPEVRARNLKEAHRVKTAKLQLVEQQT
nr:LOW QUALITY PROTEIN: rho guanine nucleotide exchange factor 5 [Odocoileus virginianus texanus]